MVFRVSVHPSSAAPSYEVERNGGLCKRVWKAVVDFFTRVAKYCWREVCVFLRGSIAAEGAVKARLAKYDNPPPIAGDFIQYAVDNYRVELAAKDETLRAEFDEQLSSWDALVFQKILDATVRAFIFAPKEMVCPPFLSGQRGTLCCLRKEFWVLENFEKEIIITEFDVTLSDLPTENIKALFSGMKEVTSRLVQTDLEVFKNLH